ncbi:hypothetical protein [Fredinandcohnia quinoae]|uniref:Uncharacterized protein n=1 Tax=Fredinandcohnia quinoae TaxID=2918902 RepID=A0AAW5EFX4_9BACI|nr:hypothetical protein [Fredinandcohnia sp. SECRCQ15]MCH1627744.1 hypothetical protein [Fredinandcohnia sp. SECRCQ15]
MIANSRINSGVESFELEVEITEEFGINPSIKIPLENGGYITAGAEVSEFKKSIFRLVGEFQSV